MNPLLHNRLQKTVSLTRPIIKSTWVASLVFTFLQRISLFVFGVCGYFILAHVTFTNEQMGIYALFQTIVSMLEFVKMGLLRNALIKFFHDSEFRHQLPEVQTASLVINAVFSAGVIVLLVGCSGWIASLLKAAELASLLRWSIILVVLLIPFNHCEIMQQSRLQYKFTFWAYFIRQGLIFVFIAASLFFSSRSFSLQYLVAAHITAVFIATVFFLVISRKYLQSRLVFNKRITYRLFQFGKYVFGTALLSNIYKFADHFVTAYAIGSASQGKILVSYYNMVLRISGILDVPFMAAADVLFPKNAQAISLEGHEKVKYYFERSVGTLTALIVPGSILIFCTAPQIIRLVGGAGYLPAVPILQITMVFAFLRPFFNQFGFTMDSIGRPQVNFLMNAVFLVISLVSTYLCIRWFGGLMGAVYATVFVLVSGCCIFYLVLHKVLHIQTANILGYAFSTYGKLFIFIRNFLKSHHEPA